MISRGCDTNTVGGVLSSTPLHWAARQGHTKVVALLAKNGADLDKRDVEGEQSVKESLPKISLRLLTRQD